MSELLLELFSEEIPAKMQVNAAKQMLFSLEKEIKNLQLDYLVAQFFVTPRRITLHIEGLPDNLPEKIIEKKGPRIDARPEAIEGFLKSVGMKLEELLVIDGFYYAKKLEAARPVDLTIKALIEQLLISFTWPKSMHWGKHNIKWVRPLHNILCLFAGRILPVEFGHLKANNYSWGHRFMKPERMEIGSFADYQDKMRKAYVILSPDERREIIVKQVSVVTNKLNLRPILEQGLLAEVVGLVEYPNVLLGKIEQQFIDLPKEALVTAMKVHQRYFYLEDSKGDIAPYFIVVANVNNNDELVIAGNEKVLRARLSDAKFFWEQDLKQPSSQCLAKLARMTFHNKLGTMFDKTNRLIMLAEFIGEKLSFNVEKIKKAALLAKTDLVSEMVGEFPELQGIMGKYYAERSGESAEVALAIAEHYRPADTNDIGDISLLGAIIAIADKLDSIVGLWIAGEKPTSSKDPFALRRMALGIIKLIRYHKLSLSLSLLINKAVENYSLVFDNDQQQEILAFFNDRLKYYLKAENFRHDLILAVIEKNSDNIYEAVNKVTELQVFVASPHAPELLFAIKRIINLVDYTIPIKEVKEELLNAIELRLYQESTALKTSNDIKSLLTELNKLVPIINQFFVEVMVNDPDINLRQNRLSLLHNVAKFSQQIADFKQIEV